MGSEMCIRDRLLSGSSVDVQVLHSWKLLRESMPSWRWCFGWLRLMAIGQWRVVAIAWLGGAIVCFQDFETAALMQVDLRPASWTVWLFDARAANEQLSRLVRFAAWPIGVQVVLVGSVLALMRSGAGRAAGRAIRGDVRTESARVGVGRFKGLAWLVLVPGFLSVVVWPFAAGGREFGAGLWSLFQQGELASRFGQVAASYAVCGFSAIFSLWAAAELQAARSRLWSIVFLLPGLSGSLVLSLLMLKLVQLPSLNAIYDSWLPMVLGQTLWLLPRAWLLVWLLRESISQESLHSARLLLPADDSRRRGFGASLLWRINCVRWLLAGAVLSHWAFWDVAIVSALRPVGFEPTVCRLYAEMHYGHTESLMALTVMSVVFPGLAFGFAALASRGLIGWPVVVRFLGARQ